MSFSSKYCYWSVSHEESRKPWRCCPHDIEVTDDDYEFTHEAMQNALKAITKGACPNNDTLYFRGDNYAGDRTNYLEVVNRDYIDEHIIMGLQRFLRDHDGARWRIIVTGYNPNEDIIIIYPYSIRAKAELEQLAVALYLNSKS